MTEVVPSVRASDADRERVAAIVSSAAGQGMLTLEEADERLARVWAARYVAELAPITADLPDAGRRLAPVDHGVRAAARAAFGRHLALYLIGVALLVALWAASGADFFWPAWPIIGFGFGVWAHARAVRHAGDPAYAGAGTGSHSGAAAGSPAAIGPGRRTGWSGGPWAGPWAFGGCGARRYQGDRYPAGY